jgi:hypothetical protein
VVQVYLREVAVQVQEQVQELEEQELPLQEVVLPQQEQALGQELQSEAQALQQEAQVPHQQGRAQVLEQGQVVLLQLARVREQVLVLEAQVRALAGVMAQAEEQVLTLALGVGLRQVVLEQGQVVLA